MVQSNSRHEFKHIHNRIEYGSGLLIMIFKQKSGKYALMNEREGFYRNCPTTQREN